MPSKPPSRLSTRLENLQLGPQGAAFELDGHAVQLDARGYAAPVAAFQEFYHQALADYYQRSAELSRPAPPRVPLLGRMLSWVGRMLGHLRPGSPRPEVPHPLPSVAPAPPPPGGRETAARPTEIPPRVSHAEPRGRAPTSGPVPPMLHVVFADQDGVHVIWQLAPAKAAGVPAARDQADPKASPPRLELTYGLDSTIAQRLQGCYGQLAQLGYKIAGLDSVSVRVGAARAEKKPATPVPASPAIAPQSVATEKSVDQPAKAVEPRPRKPPVASSTAPRETSQPSSEPARRDPSLLPGL